MATSRPNIYSLIPKKYLKDEYVNPNKYMPKHPARILFCGSSGSGKTSTLIWMINEAKNFEKIYLYAKKLEEPLYKWLIDTWEEKSEEIGECLIEYGNDIDDIIEIDSVDENIQNLIIFDDLITEKNLSKVSDFFIRGRKQNCTMAFLTQAYHLVPTQIRNNSNYFIFMPKIKGRDLTNIAIAQSGGIDSRDFKEMYMKATKDGKSFFMIDDATVNPSLQFRKNFDFSLFDNKKITFD